jgi:hypothetical protein
MLKKGQQKWGGDQSPIEQFYALASQIEKVSLFRLISGKICDRTIEGHRCDRTLYPALFSAGNPQGLESKLFR